jgi:hypothetical protein
MIRNAQQILEQFPDWQVWIYMAQDVPEETRSKLRKFTNVVVLPVSKGNMIDRFTAIDDPRVELMMVRDADSRIHARDAGCVRDFEKSSKSFHIIRDHNGHWYKILGGMWGMRREAFAYLGAKSIRELYQKFTGEQNNAAYGHDQDFLAQFVYPKLSMSNLLVHDDIHKFEKDAQVYASFSVKLQGLDFVGQSYEVNDNGQDIPLFKIEDYAQ